MADTTPETSGNYDQKYAERLQAIADSAAYLITRPELKCEYDNDQVRYEAALPIEAIGPNHFGVWDSVTVIHYPQNQNGPREGGSYINIWVECERYDYDYGIMGAVVADHKLLDLDHEIAKYLDVSRRAAQPNARNNRADLSQEKVNSANALAFIKRALLAVHGFDTELQPPLVVPVPDKPDAIEQWLINARDLSPLRKRLTGLEEARKDPRYVELSALIKERVLHRGRFMQRVRHRLIQKFFDSPS